MVTTRRQTAVINGPPADIFHPDYEVGYGRPLRLDEELRLMKEEDERSAREKGITIREHVVRYATRTQTGVAKRPNYGITARARTDWKNARNPFFLRCERVRRERSRWEDRQEVRTIRVDDSVIEVAVARAPVAQAPEVHTPVQAVVGNLQRRTARMSTGGPLRRAPRINNQAQPRKQLSLEDESENSIEITYVALNDVNLDACMVRHIQNQKHFSKYFYSFVHNQSIEERISCWQMDSVIGEEDQPR